MLDELRRLLIDALHLDREPDELDPDTALFGTGLSLDSIDALELVVALEEALGRRLVARGEAVPAVLRTLNTLADRVLEER